MSKISVDRNEDLMNELAIKKQNNHSPRRCKDRNKPNRKWACAQNGTTGVTVMAILVNDANLSHKCHGNPSTLCVCVCVETNPPIFITFVTT